MHPVEINDEEMERLRVANETKKYGHLVSAKELYLFQRTIANPSQIQEITRYIRRKRAGEKITFPLKDCEILK